MTTLRKEMESIKKYQLELLEIKNTIFEIKKFTGKFNSRLKPPEER